MAKNKSKKFLGVIIGIVVIVTAVFYVNIRGTRNKDSEQEKPNVLVLEHKTGLGVISDYYNEITDKFRKDHPELSFNWISVNSQYDPNVAISALQQKLALKRIDLIVTTGEPVTEAVLSFMKGKKIFVLGLFCSGQENIDRSNKEKYHQFFSADMDEIYEPIADFLKPKVNKIAVLYVADAFGHEAFSTLKKNYIDEDHQIVFSDMFSIGELNVRDLVQKTISFNPEAIVVSGYGAGYENIFRMLKQNQYKGLVVTDTPAGRMNLYKTTDGALEGVYFPLMKVDQKKFKDTGVQSYQEMIIYDAFNYIHEAFKNNKEISQENFQKEEKYSNIVTTYFLPEGKSRVDTQMAIWKDGKIVPLDTLDNVPTNVQPE
ncbi:MAG: amino acid ABC transporter substrate-binding protein [Alphaproteobacteria bacterium]|nr:amino acid ABC transporter substrate-binding protein [Alphaproteobacteria bacterium]